MRTRFPGGLAAAAVLALIGLALTSSASARTSHWRSAHWRPTTVRTHQARPGMGPAHWFGRGRYGWSGKGARQART